MACSSCQRRREALLLAWQKAVDAVRPSKYGQGRGPGWAKIRKRVMDRDKWLCQPCAKAGRLTVATQCDHIIPLCQQGPTEDSNLQAICDDCHDIKSKREANGGKDVRVIKGCDAEGWPLP